MIFHPRAATVKVLICLVVTFIFLMATTFLRFRFTLQPISGLKFGYGVLTLLSLGLAVYFAYLALAYAQLHYTLDRNGLRIQWGISTHWIPMTAVQAMYPTSPALLPDRFLLGLPIPGWWVGRHAQTHFYVSTLNTSLLIRTDDEDFVISPLDRDGFIEAWEKRRTFGQTQTWKQRLTHRFPFDLALWSDSLGKRLLSSTIVGYLILIGTIFILYPRQNLISTSPLFDQTTGGFSQSQSVFLAILSSLLLGLNLVLGIYWHKRDPLATYLLWSVTLLTQIGIWITIQNTVV